MSNISTTPVNFNFHGDNLLLISFNDQPFVAMRPVIEGMGLAWAPQYVKLGERFKSTVTMIVTVGEDGRNREMLCLPLRKLAAWLYSVNANKVKPELRDKVIAYQNECDDALWDYWNQGFAVRKSYAVNQSDVLTAAQAEEIRLLLKRNCDRLPQEKKAAFMTKGWSKLKSHFGVSYRQIPQMEFTEAISLVSRHCMEWVAEDRVTDEQNVCADQLMELFSRGNFHLSYQDGNLAVRPLPDSCTFLQLGKVQDVDFLIDEGISIRALPRVISRANARLARYVTGTGLNLFSDISS